MSKIKNGGLDQYGAGPFEPQQFGTAGVEAVKTHSALHGCVAGKRAGVVTTTRVTHATPAPSYAHSADRNWECDVDVPSIYRYEPLCRDIAVQLVDDNSDFNVRRSLSY